MRGYKVRTIAYYVSLVMIATMAAGEASAKDVGYEIRLDKKKTGPGRQVRMEAVFNDAKDIPAPPAPEIKGLDIKYVRSYNDKVVSGGRTLERLIHVYRITPTREGSYTIGPIAFDHAGDRYTSDVKALTVERDVSAAKMKDLDAPALAAALKDHISLKIDILRTKIYMNEKMPVWVRLKSDWLDLENITLWEASSPDLIIEKFGEKSVAMEDSLGVRYVVLSYPSSLFGVTAGVFKLDPVKVRFDIAKRRIETEADRNTLLNDNEEFYNAIVGSLARRAVELMTSPLEVRVEPLPVDGRPVGFTGAVGNFKLSMKADREKAGTGEPVMVTLTVTGDGNYDTVRVPDIGKASGISTYSPSVVKEADKAVSEQMIKINSLNVKEIPAVDFTFFDPGEERYVTVTAGPLPITVEGVEIAPSDAVKSAPAEKKAVKEEEIQPLKAAPGSSARPSTGPFGGPVAIAIQAIPLIVLFAGSLCYGRIRYLESDPQYAAFLAASARAVADLRRARDLCKRGNADIFYVAVFNAMQQYLGTRMLRPAEGIAGGIADELESRRVARDAVIKVRKVFDCCYEARYTIDGASPDKMSSAMEALASAVEALNREKSL